MESRLGQIAKHHPPDRSKFFQIFVGQDHAGTRALLEREEYRLFRYIFDMERSLLDELPEFPMPKGLEIRPVLPEHYRLIWEAAMEASQDSLGFQIPTKEEYEAWQKDPVLFQPQLWQIAWDIDSNQIAGQVQTFINQAENKKFNRKRGYTERITVRRPWRRRGLARALISISLKVQRANGMTESALSVDADNPSGATRIYEDCGFQITKRDLLYRKPLEIS
jgi:ribosomal protein S18 acetylase RimI-like enzyme